MSVKDTVPYSFNMLDVTLAGMAQVKSAHTFGAR